MCVLTRFGDFYIEWKQKTKSSSFLSKVWFVVRNKQNYHFFLRRPLRCIFSALFVNGCEMTTLVQACVRISGSGLKCQMRCLGPTTEQNGLSIQS